MDLFTIDPDGSGLQHVVNTRTFLAVPPSWSADGSKLAVAYRDGAPDCHYSLPTCEIDVMNPDGSGRMLLSPEQFNTGDSAPAWSPDGQRLAFEVGEDLFGQEQFHESDVYVMTATGAGRTLVVGWPGVDYGHAGEPDWSPNGDSIAFGSRAVDCVYSFENDRYLCEYLEGDLYKVGPDGGAVSALTSTSDFSEAEPSWSPDGERLTFRRQTATCYPAEPDYELPAHCDYGQSDIYSMNADGTSLIRLTSMPTEDELTPAWSPDGTKIAFVRAGSLYTMNADGSGEMLVTTNASAPDWQPLHALDPFPRPGGGTPLRVPLVPAYRSCASPNTTHAPPLDRPSCSPPGLISSVLTTSTVGRQSAFARLIAQPGNTTTPADETDIAINVSASDVRCADTNAACPAGADSDFAGKLLMRAAIRSTDRSNGYGGVSASSEDTRIELPFECTPTADPNRGSTCAATSSADALLPGLAVEGKRSVLSAFSVVVRDPGPNGSGYGAGCPPACGDGDEAEYLRQGVFFGS